MKRSAGASPQNPPHQSDAIEDKNISDLTKKEIIFWARKLNLTASEIFDLSQEELSERLEAIHRNELIADERKARFAEWEQLTKMKQFLIEQRRFERFPGGQELRRTVWDILCEAANEIQELYGDSQKDTVGTSEYSSSSSYEDSASFSGYSSPLIEKMLPASCELNPDDSQCTPPDFPFTLSALPVNFPLTQFGNDSYNISPSGKSLYNLGIHNATLDICSQQGPPNATFDICSQWSGNYNSNATYDVFPKSAPYNKCRDAKAACDDFTPAKAPFNVSRGANGTYDVGAPEKAIFNTYNISACQNKSFDVSRGGNAANATFNASRGADRIQDVRMPPSNTSFNIARDVQHIPWGKQYLQSNPSKHNQK